MQLKEKLEELLTKVLEVQTPITEWTEEIEMVLNAPHSSNISRFCRLSNPSSQLQEKLEETSRKLQAAQITLNITSLGLKENLIFFFKKALLMPRFFGNLFTL